jgi:hypothetical protein
MGRRSYGLQCTQFVPYRYSTRFTIVCIGDDVCRTIVAESAYGARTRSGNQRMGSLDMGIPVHQYRKRSLCAYSMDGGGRDKLYERYMIWDCYVNVPLIGRGVFRGWAIIDWREVSTKMYKRLRQSSLFRWIRNYFKMVKMLARFDLESRSNSAWSFQKYVIFPKNREDEEGFAPKSAS